MGPKSCIEDVIHLGGIIREISMFKNVTEKNENFLIPGIVT